MRNWKGMRSLLGAVLAGAVCLGPQGVWARQPNGEDAAEDASALDNSNCPPDPNPAATPPRCPWYVRAEGVMLMRDAEDATNMATLTSASNVVLSTRDLDYPFKGGPRLLIGHTLNPWNQVEVSYFALEHWSDAVAIRDDTANGLGSLGNLASPFSNFGRPAVQGLDYNNFVSIAAKSTLDNGEVNWRHILDMPPGRLSTSLLVGMRYMSIREQFEYDSASAEPAPLGAENSLQIGTANKLFGLQLGALLEFYSEGRWWVNFEMKGAICQNDAKLRTDYTNVDQGATTEFLSSRREHGTSWVGDIALTVVYRFSPRLNARFGYQAIWVTGLALADENFQRDVDILKLGPPQINHTGTVVYHGPFAGIELAW